MYDEPVQTLLNAIGWTAIYTIGLFTMYFTMVV